MTAVVVVLFVWKEGLGNEMCNFFAVERDNGEVHACYMEAVRPRYVR